MSMLDGLSAIFTQPTRRHTVAEDFPAMHESWREDALALRGDWQRVGGDIRSAMMSIAGEICHG